MNWETVPATRREVIVGAATLLLWIFFFGLGLSVPTASLRDAVIASIDHRAYQPSTQPSSSASITGTRVNTPPARTDLSRWTLVQYMLIIVGAFTISNLWFLCIFCGFLGCMTRRWSTPFEPSDLSRGQLTRQEIDAIKDLWRSYTTAVLRGFLAYLLIVAGYLFVVPENSLAQLTQGQYARLAGSVSAFAFLVGYEPRSIFRLFRPLFASAEDSSKLPGTSNAGAIASNNTGSDNKPVGTTTAVIPTVPSPNTAVTSTAGTGTATTSGV
jgi:hypothetical protein